MQRVPRAPELLFSLSDMEKEKEEEVESATTAGNDKGRRRTYKKRPSQPLIRCARTASEVLIRGAFLLDSN